jgi:hypothetical protein
MPLIVLFPGTQQMTLVEVRGRGYSLIQMAQACTASPTALEARRDRFPKHASGFALCRWFMVQ